MLRKTFVGINDFTAQITQEKQLSLMKRKMVASGEVRFKKPDTFYMELYSPYASRVLLKDNSRNTCRMLPGYNVEAYDPL
jgi:outer membrane lipoprotein carrier protein